MDLSFTKEQQMLRKSVAEFLAKECPFDHVKELEDSKDGYSKKLWKKMAALGWLEMHFPENYGGLGDSFSDTTIIMEEMGKKAFPSPYFSTVVVCGTIIVEGGSEAQKKTLLPQIAAGKLILALAQIETDSTFLPVGIELAARPLGGKYILNGSKHFVLDANIAHKLIVVANAPEGITLLMVDTDSSGLTVEKRQTIAKDNNCTVCFENVSVPAENRIGEPGEGWKILEKMAPKATVAKCAEMIGGCGEVIDETKEYAKQRHQYGSPIGGFQAIQHDMANMKVGYDTALFYLHKVAWMIDERSDTTVAASSLKAHVNEMYKFIADRGVQIHGGIGTTREYNVGLFYRRAKAFEFLMGDTDHHYEKVAESLLG